jgi:hypothetical protein
MESTSLKNGIILSLLYKPVCINRVIKREFCTAIRTVCRITPVGQSEPAPSFGTLNSATTARCPQFSLYPVLAYVE